MQTLLPPLGSKDRLEIEEIRDRLEERGYHLQLRRLADGTWIAALLRHGLRGASAPAYGAGQTPAEAARRAQALYEATPSLNSFAPDRMPDDQRRDRYFFTTNGTLIVRKDPRGAPELVTWLPNDRTRPDYPGFTLDSGFPTDRGVAGVLEWAAEQDWVGDTGAAWN